jgi:hypothetical protein
VGSVGRGGKVGKDEEENGTRPTWIRKIFAAWCLHDDGANEDTSFGLTEAVPSGMLLPTGIRNNHHSIVNLSINIVCPKYVHSILTSG